VIAIAADPVPDMAALQAKLPGLTRRPRDR
jgi:hypothetical protein